MNNKKGFTLIELIVSVVLVSIVLVALVGSLLQLRNAYTIVHENSDVIVYTSSISRAINSDINNNNGIKYVSCEPDGKKCSIILGNDERRELLITENDKILPDLSNAAIKHSNNKTTLKYLDTTRFDKTNNEGDKKLIYIRTLELNKYENDTSQTVTSNGHNFYDMSANQYEYFDSTNNYIDAFTTLTIRLLDGVNLDLSKYNITLYGSGRYDYSKYVGRVYHIDLDNSGADTAGTTAIDEVFGVGFFVAESAHTKRDQIKKIDLPTKKVNDEPKVFKGYFYKPYGNGVETQIIDASGNIFASSRTFKNDVILNEETTGKVYAKWGDIDPGYIVTPTGEVEPREFTVTLNKDQAGKTCNTVGTNSYLVKYDSMVKNITIPQCAGYTFEGYLDEASKSYHDRFGTGLALYDKISDSTFNASWHACNQGQYSLITQTTCNDCTKGTYSSSTASGSCTVCQNGTTTSSSGASSCNINCLNNNAHVLSWTTPTWNENTNVLTNECKISECKTGYDGQLSSNKCEANTYKITFNLNGGTLNNNSNPSDITVTYDEVVTIVNPKRAGESFEGWSFNGNTSTAIHGSTAWTSFATLTKDTTFKNLIATNGGTVTLTANWGSCPVGTYNDGTTTGCQPCPAGTYTGGPGQASCITCEDGYYCPGGQNRVACAAGKEGTGTGKTTEENGCSTCQIGYYSNTTGTATCSACTAGKYNSTRGNTTCTTCEDGYYCPGAQDRVACAAGKEGTGTGKTTEENGCSLCLDGYYSTSSGTATCTACAAGKEGTGRGKTSESDACSNCQIGYYSTSSGTATCTACPAGKYNNARGQTSCTTCEDGYYCPGAQDRVACAAGKEGTGTGKSTEENGCSGCGPGKFSTARGTATCSSCSAGTFSTGAANTTCTTCVAGSYSTAGSSRCTACGAGRTSTAGSATCSNCPPITGVASWKESTWNQNNTMSNLCTVNTCQTHYRVNGNTCQYLCNNPTQATTSCTGWSGWSNCSKACGTGSQSHSRTCPTYSTIDSSHQCGTWTQTANQNCNTQTCCSSTHDSCGNYGNCSKACGTGTQSRTCTKISDYDNSNCGTYTQQQNCNTQTCCSSTYNDCPSTWSACSKSCGGGTQSRTCTKRSNYDRSSCGTYTEQQSCNTQACVCCPNGGTHSGNNCYTGCYGGYSEIECKYEVLGIWLGGGTCCSGSYADSC